MHNSQVLANPVHPVTKAMSDITAKRQRMTDEDRIELSNLEWRAGLYLNADNRVVLTGDVLWGFGRDGAKKSTKGKQWQAGVMVPEDAPLVYKGPKDIEALFADPNFRDVRSVKIGQSRTMRTRPIFRDWSALVSYLFDPTILSRDAIIKALQNAASYCGMCDFRPRFGSCEVEVVE